MNPAPPAIRALRGLASRAMLMLLAISVTTEGKYVQGEERKYLRFVPVAGRKRCVRGSTAVAQERCRARPRAGRRAGRPCARPAPVAALLSQCASAAVRVGPVP